jgi:hypothetical protein
MKTLFNLFLILIVFCSASLAQYAPGTYDNKIAKYKRMRTAGIIMGIGGAVLTTVGISVLSTSDWEESEDMYGNTNVAPTDGDGWLGLFAVGVGVPLTAVGITLGIIGNNKVKYYTKKNSGLSLNLKYGPRSKGLSLRYSF